MISKKLTEQAVQTLDRRLFNIIKKERYVDEEFLATEFDWSTYIPKPLRPNIRYWEDDGVLFTNIIRPALARLIDARRLEWACDDEGYSFIQVAGSDAVESDEADERNKARYRLRPLKIDATKQHNIRILRVADDGSIICRDCSKPITDSGHPNAPEISSRLADEVYRNSVTYYARNYSAMCIACGTGIKQFYCYSCRGSTCGCRVTFPPYDGGRHHPYNNSYSGHKGVSDKDAVG